MARARLERKTAMDQAAAGRRRFRDDLRSIIPLLWVCAVSAAFGFAAWFSVCSVAALLLYFPWGTSPSYNMIYLTEYTRIYGYACAVLFGGIVYLILIWDMRHAAA